MTARALAVPHPLRWLSNHRTGSRFIGDSPPGRLSTSCPGWFGDRRSQRPRRVRAAQVYYGPLNTVHQGIYLALVPEGAARSSSSHTAFACSWCAPDRRPRGGGGGVDGDRAGGARRAGSGRVPRHVGRGQRVTAPGRPGDDRGQRGDGSLRRCAVSRRCGREPPRPRLQTVPPQLLLPLVGAAVASGVGFVLGLGLANLVAAADLVGGVRSGARHPARRALRCADRTRSAPGGRHLAGRRCGARSRGDAMTGAGERPRWPSCGSVFGLHPRRVHRLRELGVDLQIFHQAAGPDAPFSDEATTAGLDAHAWSGAPDDDRLEAALAAAGAHALLVSSWHITAYRRVARRRRGRTLRVLCMDNQWWATPKQWLGVRRAGPDPPDLRRGVPSRRAVGRLRPTAGVLRRPDHRRHQHVRRSRFHAVAVARCGRALSERTFTFVGRLVRDKGIDVLAEGYRRYRQMTDDPCRSRSPAQGPRPRSPPAGPASGCRASSSPTTWPRCSAGRVASCCRAASSPGRS